MNRKKAINSSAYENLVADAIFIRHKNLFHRIRLEDIIYVKSDSIYVEIHTSFGRKYLHRSSMTNFFKELPEHLFIQIHQSYIVNIQHLSAINSVYILMGNKEIPLGRKYRKRLMETIRSDSGTDEGQNQNYA